MNLIIIFLIVIFNNFNKVIANKYCSLESNGEPKYYICARNEYCCHFGCCVHLAFQFYQLWYYWLLLIFMFMICSGGSWWYKFCRQNEQSNYPSAVTAYERCTGRHNMTTSLHHDVRSSVRRSRNTYDRNLSNNHNLDNASACYFQRLWKANTTTPPPNYYTASVVRYHSASELETRRQHQECPYYQLYGPPPSYESVIRVPENGCGPPSCTLIAPPTTNDFVNNVNINNTNSNVHNINDNLIPTTTSTIDNSIPSLSSNQSQKQQQAIIKQNNDTNQYPSTSIQADYHHDCNEDDDDDDDNEITASAANYGSNSIVESSNNGSGQIPSCSRNNQQKCSSAVSHCQRYTISSSSSAILAINNVGKLPQIITPPPSSIFSSPTPPPSITSNKNFANATFVPSSNRSAPSSITFPSTSAFKATAPSNCIRSKITPTITILEKSTTNDIDNERSSTIENNKNNARNYCKNIENGTQV